jgi:hypothetical protein
MGSVPVDTERKQKRSKTSEWHPWDSSLDCRTRVWARLSSLQGLGNSGGLRRVGSTLFQSVLVRSVPAFADYCPLFPACERHSCSYSMASIYGVGLGTSPAPPHQAEEMQDNLLSEYDYDCCCAGCCYAASLSTDNDDLGSLSSRTDRQNSRRCRTIQRFPPHAVSLRTAETKLALQAPLVEIRLEKTALTKMTI